ncbi:hypothetical protein [Clostridium amylolyticum]|uniref:hypothetical protein n=1 Tax=Clostridium amylolyticum TaxID=1121298 RepID=UPI000935174C|nr:hypothetical protein [Clostridium amylolyticum]
MGNGAIINLESFSFQGDVLDISYDNMGIIYNIFKSNESSSEIDYIDNGEKHKMEKSSYDNAVIFFFLNSMMGNKSKVIFIEEIYEYLKEKGTLYIWDIDKKLNMSYKNNIKVILPQGNSKEFTLKDYNIFKDSSLKNTINILEPFFELEEYKAWDGIYFIRAKKKGRELTNAKSITSRNKLKIHSQQLSNKIFKGIFKKS